MFDAKTLFQIGEYLRLHSNSHPYKEAMLRSSIGRYYYACYHAAKMKCINKNHWDDKNRTNHRTVVRELRDNNNELGGCLDTLRTLREHADYHVWNCKTLSQDRREHPKCDCDWDPDTDANCNEAARIARWIMDEI